MRTNIDIDDRLMRQAMRLSGARTKKRLVEGFLRLLVETHTQTAIRRLFFTYYVRQFVGRSVRAANAAELGSADSRGGCPRTILAPWLEARSSFSK